MKKQSNIRVRFAPSPTGQLHIGSLRTAWFNWLFARHHGGKFLLRIEDTDQERSQATFTDAIFEALAWTQIESDEPIVIQSEREKEHRAFIDRLLFLKKAYRCYCTVDEIEKRCAVTMASGVTVTKYDGLCRTQPPADFASRSFVIRVALPQDQDEITFTDLVKGPVTFSMNELDDFIIARSTGEPLYNVAVVADDIAMGITHIIRGEDHIANTPKQIFLYQAIGASIPCFAHIPMVLNKTGGRLSKRDGATGVIEYREAGFLPDALLNYLVRLGWSHGDQELFKRDELINFFSLEKVGSHGAAFDEEKLRWLNGMYIRSTDDQILLDYLQAVILPHSKHELTWNDQQLLAVIALYKDRVSTMRELFDSLVLIYRGPVSLERNQVNSLLSNKLVQFFESLDALLQGLSASFTIEEVTNAMQMLLTEHQLKLPEVAKPLRYALVGSIGGPSIYGLLAAAGKHETVRRIGLLLAQAR